jgi:PQQ enzyme repeat
MAIKGAIPMNHGDVWPYGCFVVGEVQAMRDFDRSTKDQAVQAVDRDTGELVWTVDVVDADPEARERTVRVKLLAAVQPVPPAAAEGVPFRPVEFDGLTATPYVATTLSGRGRLAWSFRATGMRAPARVSAGAGNGKAG